MTADEIFRELLEIRERLEALPRDDAERVELEVRRAVLHDRARSLDESHDQQLARRVDDMTRRIEAIEKMRLDGANMAGLVGIGGGMDPEMLKFVNDSIEKNHDLASLRAELAALKRQLREGDE